MKKFLSLLLVSTLVFTFVACSNEKDTTSDINTSTIQTESTDNAETTDSGIIDESSIDTETSSNSNSTSTGTSNPTTNSTPSNTTNSTPSNTTSKPNETISQTPTKTYPSVLGTDWVFNKTGLSKIDLVYIEISFSESPKDIADSLVYGFIHYYDYYLYENLSENEKKQYSESSIMYYNGKAYVLRKQIDDALVTFVEDLKEEKNIVTCSLYESKRINLKLEKISETKMKIVSISNPFTPFINESESLLSIGDTFEKVVI